MIITNIQTYQKQIGDGQIHMMHIHPTEDRLHSHTYFELVYIVNGTATHHLGDETTSLKAGDYFIIDTGSVHCYRDTKDFEIVNCLFLPEYVDRALIDCPSLSSLLSNQILRFGVSMSIRAADKIFRDSDGTVGRSIRTMEREYSTQQTGYAELMRCHLTQILVCAVRASEEMERTRTFHSATATMVDYLRQHYTQPLSLESLSQLMGYTPQYLSNLFHKDTGVTLQHFLQLLRIEKACQLLNNRTLRMADVAQTVGYSDVKYFSRVFKRHKGVSPKEFKATLE